MGINKLAEGRAFCCAVKENETNVRIVIIEKWRWCVFIQKLFLSICKRSSNLETIFDYLSIQLKAAGRSGGDTNLTISLVQVLNDRLTKKVAQLDNPSQKLKSLQQDVNAIYQAHKQSSTK
jgi:hypothetical protein